MAQGFNELRDAVFAKVDAARGAPRWRFGRSAISMRCRLRFHLDRRTGGLVARDRARHRRHRVPAVLLLFNVVPTMFEILLVCGDPVAALRFGSFAAVTLVDHRRSTSPSPSSSPTGGCTSAAR